MARFLCREIPDCILSIKDGRADSALYTRYRPCSVTRMVVCLMNIKDFIIPNRKRKD